MSAKTLDRPALGRALEMLRSGAARALLVVKLDRLTRSVRDLCDLVDTYFGPTKRKERERALLSVHEQIDTRTAGGQMVLKLLTVIAEWERKAIGERTSVAMQHKARAGEYTGGRARYGYAVAEDGVALVEADAEQTAIAEAKVLRSSGLSLRAVAKELADRGIRARNGRAFAATQVARMVAA